MGRPGCVRDHLCGPHRGARARRRADRSGGLLFGITAGSLLTFLGATLGATIAFGVARPAGRRAVDRLVSGRVERVDRWLGARGFGAVLALRLVPLVPFSAANYAAGVTAVRLRDYVAGTAIGIIPGVVVYTVIGARVSEPTDPVFIGAVVALVLLAGVGTVSMHHARGRAGARHGDEPEEQPATVGTGHE